MIQLAKTLSSKVEKGKRIVKALVSGKNDTRTAHQASPANMDSAPVEDDNLIGLYAFTGTRGEPVLIGYLNREAVVNPGEIKLYSLDSGASEQAYFYLKNDGIAELNGDGDFVTRFLEMEKAFNELKDDLNSLIDTYNTHTHPFTGVAPGSPGTTSKTPKTGTNSQADMADAKVEEVKTKAK
jgi:hypothetical protein